MVFELQENDVIKKQNIEITETMMGIYGYNNSGKTIVLTAKLLRVFYVMLTKGVNYDPKKMVNDIKRPAVYLQTA